MRFLTWNIQNRKPVPPYDREEALCRFIRETRVDLLFLQEIPSRMLSLLSAHLPAKEVIGVGREDGAYAGEFVPLLVLAEDIEVRDKGWFWLGPTPDIPSKAWFALCPRLCTWALLEKKNRLFFVVNNHWDHFSFYSRQRGWQQVLAKWIEIAPRVPSLFAGDFNLRPRRRLFRRILYNGHRPLQDFWQQHHRTHLKHTFTGFVKSWGQARVDHFFGSPEWQVKACEILPIEKSYSDHRPLLLEADIA